MFNPLLHPHSRASRLAIRIFPIKLLSYASKCCSKFYETNIARIKTGKSATISSEYGGFEGKLRGQVEHLGLQVGAKQLIQGSQDPTQDENARIVEVKIRIHPQDSPKVSGLTNMKVRVEINR